MDVLSISNGNFTLDLFKNLDQSSQNLFFSSWSISSALSMVYLGARNNTATEMARVGSSILLFDYQPFQSETFIAIGHKGTVATEQHSKVCDILMKRKQRKSEMSSFDQHSCMNQPKESES